MTSMNTSGLRRRIGAVVCCTFLGLTLSACGSGSAGTTATGGSSATSPTPGTSSPGTSTQPSEQPSANVTTSKGVTEWASQVCLAAKKMQDSLKPPDVAEIQTDPQKYINGYIKSWKKLAVAMDTIADDVEQIGAPDVPNGEEWTEVYIDSIRELADVMDDAADKADKAGGGQAGMMVVLNTFDSPKVKKITQELKAVNEQVEANPELEAALENDPTCKSFNQP